MLPTWTASAIHSQKLKVYMLQTSIQRNGLNQLCLVQSEITVYHKSSKETCGSYYFSEVKMQVLLKFGYFCLLFFKFTVGLIRIRVLFKGGSLS